MGWLSRFCRGIPSILIPGVINLAHSTTVLPQAPETLADSSPIVIHARVVDIEVESSSGLRSAVLKALEVVRAPSEDRSRPDFRVPLLNRVLPYGGLAEMVPGAPEFRIGEEVVAFLRPLPDSDRADGRPLYGLQGFHQGKLRVVVDERGIRRLLTWQDHPDVRTNWKRLALKRDDGRVSSRRLTTPRLRDVAPDLPASRLRTLDALLNRARAGGGS